MSGNHSVLVLNADYRPLSLFPLSVCSWQDAVKAMFSERVDVAEFYDEYISSPSMSMQIPSVIVLKNFVAGFRHPPFTRRNLYLRDMYECQYCGREGHIHGVRRGVRLTMDHVYPKSKGGPKSWENIVACCANCNGIKGDSPLETVGFSLKNKPYQPNMWELWRASRELSAGIGHIPDQWMTYLQPEK